VKGVGAALRFGASQVGGGGVVAEPPAGLVPVGAPLGVDEVGEDLAELRSADAVERRVQVPPAVVAGQDHRVALVTVAFGGGGRALGVGERLPSPGPAREVVIREVDGVAEEIPRAFGEQLVVEERVGGDAGQQLGLGHTDEAGTFAAGPDAQPPLHARGLHATERLCTGQLEAVLQPRLGREEAVLAERVLGVEVIGDGDP
jgi:hypothetical protein